jgi:zinc transport system ATP-binding protein
MSTPAITVENVTKVVDERPLLRSVSFSITSGSLVSLIGPNGAGKSTLVKIILGLDHDYTGSVAIADTEHIAYIPQISQSDRHALPLSVYEYLAIAQSGLFSKIRPTNDLRDALSHVGVDPTKLSQSFASLSGGERQRVAIARALLTDPTILVLDEPLAAVDHASRQGLYELIRHLQQDHHMTVLLVSHDVDRVMPLSDQVLCLNTTLRQDCHPTEVSGDPLSPQAVHHHC